MNVDQARNNLARHRGTYNLIEQLLRNAEQAGDTDATRLWRTELENARLARDIAEGELIYAEGMD